MKALNKLREWAEALKEERGGVVRWYCDAIERELAERWMELPVDADGAPIHVGDDLGVGTALYVSDDGVCIGGNSFGFWEATSLRHAKPVTAESLLREFAEEYGGIRTDGDELITEYAAKLREWKEAGR